LTASKPKGPEKNIQKQTNNKQTKTKCPNWW